ncbi:MAG: hypothetical protein ACOY81_05750 [Bacillota bacterium]|uniref:KOW domain-containing RNA-binding protein n=1 Tax=Desulfurispora thermophila TaxID=265470 RepID=UPI00036605E8|nr:KOW domain-containing RNA-binding protein [Desulfurispora thermophila]
MKDKKFTPGQVVISTAGRDTGRLYVVTGQAGGEDGRNLVYVVDGHIRKIDRPKKKNVRHLEDTGKLVPEIAQKIATGRKVTDQEIRQVLEATFTTAASVASVKEALSDTDG